MATKLAPVDIAGLDPYKFMAVIGKRVIHPGGRAPAHMKKMAWLMPRMAKAVPYLGYIVVAGTKPA